MLGGLFACRGLSESHSLAGRLAISVFEVFFLSKTRTIQNNCFTAIAGSCEFSLLFQAKRSEFRAVPNLHEAARDSRIGLYFLAGFAGTIPEIVSILLSFSPHKQ